jgi:hypothetical protein
MEPAARYEQKGEARAHLFVVDADRSSFVERHGDSSRGDQIRIGKAENPVVLQKTEWNVLVEAIRVWSTGRGAAKQPSPSRLAHPPGHGDTVGTESTGGGR